MESCMYTENFKKAPNPHLKVIIVPVSTAARPKFNKLASSFFRYKCDQKETYIIILVLTHRGHFYAGMAQFSTCLPPCEVD